jgi:hypothetical protein
MYACNKAQTTWPISIKLDMVDLHQILIGPYWFSLISMAYLKRHFT